MQLLNKVKQLLLKESSLYNHTNKMTEQISEILFYKEEKYYMETEPLDSYLIKNNKEFISLSSSCWRGYIGEWEIQDNKLFLINLNSYLADMLKKGPILNDVFPNQNTVFAEWFTGELVIPYGEILKCNDMPYSSVYEKIIFLEFKNGFLVGERKVDNIKEIGYPI